MRCADDGGVPASYRIRVAYVQRGNDRISVLELISSKACETEGDPMVSCALKCSVRAIALTIFVIGIATSVHAQAAKPPVNSYLAKQIERLRHPGQSRPPVTRRAKFGTPYDRIMLPGLE